MRRNPVHIVLLLFVLAFSCGKPVQEEERVITSLAAAETQLGAAAGSTFLSVGAGGAWTIQLAYADAAGNWASVSPAQGNGSKNSVIFSYGANDAASPRSVTLTLEVENGIPATLTMTQKGKESTTPGNISGYGTDVAAPKWLELPATKAGDGMEFFAHDMKGSRYVSEEKSETRNWSFYYDYESYLSRWVAYPLNRGLISTGTRTNLWGYDPLLPADLQQAIVNGAYGTGHSRGHQIPSADRLSYNANVSTFYATNLTPQDPNFNANIWADLESRVRGYAVSSDTLYVVTGCVVDDASGTLKDREGHPVRIPSAYFKALLRYHPSATQGFGGYMACGFYMPHSSSIAGKNYLDYILSIDDLERKTGLTFFVNLRAQVGEEIVRKIKSQEPVSWWK